MDVVTESKGHLWFIGGSSRTGSTLIDNILGQLPGVVSVGELVDIWDNGVHQNFLCGCGQKFQACDFWHEVLYDAFGTVDPKKLLDYRALHHEVVHYRRIPLHFFDRFQATSYQEALRRYAEVLTKLYQSILKISAANLIIDSSKRPHFGFVLRHVDLELKLIHVIRDSRAVSYSWQRKKRRPEIHWREAYMPQHGPLRSTIEWNVANLCTPKIHPNSEHYYRIKYEDFVLTPEKILADMFNRFQLADQQAYLEALESIFAGDRQVCSHSIGGNPRRFAKGPLRLRPDMEWKNKLSQKDYLITSLLSFPWLLGYGYPIK